MVPKEAMIKVHIRRPTTDKSFCEAAPVKKIVELEDRKQATCPACKVTFQKIMYSSKKRKGY